jgi:3-oxoacyl-[acyl-carrier protein] reductase/2-hydroxycyclohexanecarboxyl-CoA dehydrogenase
LTISNFVLSSRRRPRVAPDDHAVAPRLQALLSGDALSLNEKIAIVTGAGRGIGEGIARKLAEEQATVICADVNQNDAQTVASSLGHGAAGRKLDVSSSADCDALVNQVQQQFGHLDILVNNAGINRDAMLHKMTDEQWQQVLAVDLSGVFFMTRAASRIMRSAGSGRIVNIASASWMGNIGQANYSAAKAGVVGLSRTAAKELARSQVTVNAICPGFIDTQMTRGIPDVIREQQVAKIPLGRPGQPADVAALVAFLASDEAGYITGEVINVGGGYVL